MAKSKNVDCCDGNNKDAVGNFVGIAAVLGGILLVMTVLFLIFARDQLNYLLGIAWSFVLLGVFLGLFNLISMKKK